MTRRNDPQPDAEAILTEPVSTTDDDPPKSAVAEEAAIDTALPLPPPPPPLQPRASGFLGPLLGGALAAVGGFGLSHFNLFGLAAPDQGVDLAALSTSLETSRASQAATLDKLAAEVATLTDRLATLETAPTPDAPDLSRLDGLDQRLAAIESMPADATGANPALAAKVADLERRLTALPASGPSADVQKQLDDALARLDAAEAKAQAQAAEAEAAVTAARRAQALDALTVAVADGRPFGTELAALADPALSAALGPVAEAGVPTLAALQTDFPEAARSALAIARATSSEVGWSDRLVDFLAAQTGARPLTPQEGTTPDAILSRADFALSEGRVGDALTELGTLDPAVQGPLQGWIAAASSHVAAAAALQTARGE